MMIAFFLPDSSGYWIIDNKCSKVIKHSLEINEIIYLYWCISQVLGKNICCLTFLIESDVKRSDHE